MIGWLVFSAYLLGWFVGTVLGSRWLAETREGCRVNSVWCDNRHLGGGHWLGDGRVGYRELWTAALPSLVWPISLVPLAALIVANHKPTAKANAKRIEELERELGMAR